MDNTLDLNTTNLSNISFAIKLIELTQPSKDITELEKKLSSPSLYKKKHKEINMITPILVIIIVSNLSFDA